MLLAGAGQAFAQWTTLKNCEFVQGPHSDGDSIQVRHGDSSHVFRLYFVDTIETSAYAASRRAAQAKYFGMDPTDDAAALKKGRAASRLTKSLLKTPFTVHTKWDEVTPGSSNPSIRAFVETSNGKDVAEELVNAGLAILRSGPALSDHPDGRSKGQILRSLREMETSARIAGRGAWTKQPVRPLDNSTQVLTAADTPRLRDLAGESVTVRGTVSRIGWLKDHSITFLNFDGNVRGDFVSIIRKEDLPKISASLPGKQLTSLIGQSMQVTGPITLHRNTPQIELVSPDQVKLLPTP